MYATESIRLTIGLIGTFYLGTSGRLYRRREQDVQGKGFLVAYVGILDNFLREVISSSSFKDLS